MKGPAPAQPTKESTSQVPVDSAFRAIMFTDLKDSTATTTRLGDTKSLHLLHIHNAMTRNALRDHDGCEVKHLGDGIMATFSSVPKAVECAIAIQKAFVAHNQRNPNDMMHLRIGLSAGEPVEEYGDLFGSVVQLVARLCAYAEPDQIIVAQVIRDQCPIDQYQFDDLGETTPKGFNHPMHVHRVKFDG